MPSNVNDNPSRESSWSMPSETPLLNVHEEEKKITFVVKGDKGAVMIASLEFSEEKSIWKPWWKPLRVVTSSQEERVIYVNIGDIKGIAKKLGVIASPTDGLQDIAKKIALQSRLMKQQVIDLLSRDITQKLRLNNSERKALKKALKDCCWNDEGKMVELKKIVEDEDFVTVFTLLDIDFNKEKDLYKKIIIHQQLNKTYHDIKKAWEKENQSKMLDPKAMAQLYSKLKSELDKRYDQHYIESRDVDTLKRELVNYVPGPIASLQSKTIIFDQTLPLPALNQAAEEWPNQAAEEWPAVEKISQHDFTILKGPSELVFEVVFHHLQPYIQGLKTPPEKKLIDKIDAALKKEYPDIKTEDKEKLIALAVNEYQRLAFVVYINREFAFENEQWRMEGSTPEKPLKKELRLPRERFLQNRQKRTGGENIKKELIEKGASEIILGLKEAIATDFNLDEEEERKVHQEIDNSIEVKWSFFVEHLFHELEEKEKALAKSGRDTVKAFDKQLKKCEELEKKNLIDHTHRRRSKSVE